MESNIAATKYLGTLRFPSALASTLDNILKRVQEALGLPRYLEDDAAVALFKSNKIKTTKDLFQLLPKIKTLQPISKDIRTRLVPIQEFLPNNQTFAISTYTEQQQLLSIPFQDIKQELGENQELIDKLSTLRELVSNINDQFLFGRLISHLGSLMGQFSGLSETVGKFTIETKVVNYKAWSKLPAMAMPCSRQKSKTYKGSGFKEVFSYPEYFKCMVDGATAAFPDRQMGFVRITS